MDPFKPSPMSMPSSASPSEGLVMVPPPEPPPLGEVAELSVWSLAALSVAPPPGYANTT